MASGYSSVEAKNLLMPSSEACSHPATRVAPPASETPAPSSSAVTTNPEEEELLQRKQAMKKELLAQVVDPKQDEGKQAGSLETFPYHLGAGTCGLLTNLAFLHLRQPEYAKYTTKLPAVSNRVLLVGPPASDLYQERLARALAHNSGARLLVLTSALLERQEAAFAAAQKAANKLKDKAKSALKAAAPGPPSPMEGGAGFGGRPIPKEGGGVSVSVFPTSTTSQEGVSEVVPEPLDAAMAQTGEPEAVQAPMGTFQAGEGVKQESAKDASADGVGNGGAVAMEYTATPDIDPA
eukprot:gene5520-6694_t